MEGAVRCRREWGPGSAISSLPVRWTRLPCGGVAGAGSGAGACSARARLECADARPRVRRGRAGAPGPRVCGCGCGRGAPSRCAQLPETAMLHPCTPARKPLRSAARGACEPRVRRTRGRAA
jgi:hypothetical protein